MTPGPSGLGGQRGNRRLFLHVGLPKTATTYLQTSLWANKETLRSRGLLLPGANHRRHHLASQEFRKSPRLHRLVADGDRPWKRLVEEVRSFDGDALISHEFFASARTEHVVQGLADVPDHEVHVILTARPTVDVFISRWQEWVKNGNVGPIDEYPPSWVHAAGDWGWDTIDLADVLTRWSGAIAPERIHVLPLQAGRHEPEEIWLRFLSVLGVSGEGLMPAAVAANTSLGLAQVEVLRRVNRHLDDTLRSAREKGAWIRGYLGETVLSTDGPVERFKPGEEVLADLVRRSEQALDLLEASSFAVHGAIEDLRPRDVTGRRHPSEAGAEELLDAATAALAAATLLARERHEPAAPRARAGFLGRVARRVAPGRAASASSPEEGDTRSSPSAP